MKTKKINWLNTLYLTLNTGIAIVGTIILAVMGMVYWQTIVLTVVLAIFGGISITGGYHRLFSHRAYDAAWPVRLFYVLFGAATFEGSVSEWCTDHRNHHLYTDTDKDPYSIKGGFWHAHMGWLFTLDADKRDYSNVADLQKDPLVRFQNKFFIPIAIIIGYCLPIAIAFFGWGDWLGGLIIASALRIVFSQQTTFFINSICHMFGKLTYSDKSTARDNWVTALFTFGEGYHNFHHKFPIDYRNAIRFYQFDPTKWLIRTLAFLGLAKNLKTVSMQKILAYKLIMDKKRLTDTAKKITLSNTNKELVQNLYDNIMQLIHKTDKLEKAYQSLKKTKLSDLQVKADEYKVMLKNQHQELRLLKSKLKHLAKAWGYLVKDQLTLSSSLLNQSHSTS